MPMLAIGAAMAAASIGGALIGNSAAKKDRQRADAAVAKAMSELNAVGIPNVEAQKIILQNPSMVFQYDPQLEQLYNLNQSKLAELQEDPRLRQAQMKALEQMQLVGETGLTPAEAAQLRQIRNNVAAEEQARQGAIMQNLAERGMGGSGQELALRAMSSQQSAQRASEENDRTATMAYQRALDAISQAGAFGGQVRGQDFSIEGEKARAADEIEKFNLQNKMSVQERNVDRSNEAVLKREALKQDLENQRASTANQQEQYNKELLQQEFDNKFRLAQAKSAALTGSAQMMNERGASKASAAAGVGSGVSSTIGTLYAYRDKPKAPGT